MKLLGNNETIDFKLRKDVVLKFRWRDGYKLVD